METADWLCTHSLTQATDICGLMYVWEHVQERYLWKYDPGNVWYPTFCTPSGVDACADGQLERMDARMDMKIISVKHDINGSARQQGYLMEWEGD